MQLQTFFSTTSRKKHYGATRKNDFFTVDFGHVLGKRVSMGLSVWRETSKKLTVCREKGKN